MSRGRECDWDRQISFTHKGKEYLYQMEIDQEEDVRKRFHYLFERNGGAYIRLNFHPSPYSVPSEQEMRDWLDDA